MPSRYAGVSNGLFITRAEISCPRCSRTFEVPAGHIVTHPISCEHCRSRLYLTREQRLSLWANHLRRIGESLQSDPVAIAGSPAPTRRGKH